MHEITNTNRATNRTVPTTSGRVILAPGEKKSFAPGSLSAGLLRVISNAKSDLKLNNLTDDAVELVKKALGRVKKRGFAIVHGQGDITVEEALRRENSPRHPRQIRDDFDPDQRARAKSQTNLADPGEPLQNANEVDDENGEQSGSEPQAETEQQKVERVKLQDAPTPIGLLIADAEAGTVSMKELRARAKELLGDDYPAGQIGKDEVVAALTKAKKKAK